MKNITHILTLGLTFSTVPMAMAQIAPITAAYVTVLPQDAANQEGGEIALQGTTGYSPWYLDVRANYFRLHTAGSAKFVVSTNGNVGIGRTPTTKLDVNGTIRATALELTSDQAAKSEFSAVDAESVLAKVAELPISTWSYTNSPAGRHLGPMAQSFHAAFGLGESDKHISVVDGIGVSLASIQGLNRKLNAQLAQRDSQIAALEQELAALRKVMMEELAALKSVRDQSIGASSQSDPSSQTNSHDE